MTIFVICFFGFDKSVSLEQPRVFAYHLSSPISLVAFSIISTMSTPCLRFVIARFSLFSTTCLFWTSLKCCRRAGKSSTEALSFLLTFLLLEDEPWALKVKVNGD